MPSICNVPRCENHRYRNVRNNGVSVFSVPRDPKLLSSWEDALSCKLHQNQGVCEIHFKPEDVKRSLKIRDQKGKIIQEEPYKKTHLARQAIPLGRKDYRDSIVVDVKSDDQKLDSDLTSILSGIHEYDNHPKEYCIQLISDDCVESHTVDEIEPKDAIDINPQNEVSNKIDLVSAIKNGSVEITLPDKNWFYKTSKNGVLFAIMEEETTPNKRIKLTISFLKRVFITDDTISVCIKNHSLDILDLNYPKNASELEDILVRIDSLGICRGGPALNRTGTFTTACAEEDPQTNRWRHKSCKIVFPFKEGTICMECCKLYAIFDEYKKRNESQLPEKSTKQCKTKMDFEAQHELPNEFSEKPLNEIHDNDLIAGQGNKIRRFPNILRNR